MISCGSFENQTLLKKIIKFQICISNFESHFRELKVCKLTYQPPWKKKGLKNKIRRILIIYMNEKGYSNNAQVSAKANRG